MIRPILACLCCTLPPIQGPGGPGQQIVVTADTDHDGAVSAAEWKTFLAAIRAPDGSLDVRRLHERFVASLLDGNRDGKVDRADLAVIFKSLDRDGSGALEAAEIGSARRGRLAALAVGRFADADDSGAVSAEEWKAFTDNLDAARLVETLLDEQPAFEKRLAAARPGAFTFRVLVMTFDGGLDVDGDGKRSFADLERWFKATDTNQDGAIAASEVRRRRRGGRGFARRRISTADRSRPCLMPWQRNLEDALALVTRTGKPLLICVNMDGEPASESLAWGRYRDPGFAKLASGFVCLLASPNRHDARDHDDLGRRIVDRRFGRIVSGEHITIEPELFDRYFNGRRVAPRHLAIDKDGKVLFDIFMTRSLEPIDEALRKFGKPSAKPVARSEADLLASPDAADRMVLEARFAAGDVATRRRLARAALVRGREIQHPELLRMALRDASADVRRAAAAAIMSAAELAPLDHIVVAMQGASDASSAAVLADALFRAAQRDAKRAAVLRGLARDLTGLHLSSAIVDRDRWRIATSMAREVEKPLGVDELPRLEELLDSIDAKLRSKPGDRMLNLSLAEATMRYARIRLLEGKDPALMLTDVREAAARATNAERPKGRALALIAWASWLAGDVDKAREAAIQAIPLIVAGDATSRVAFEVLNVLASCRARQLYAASGADAEWPVVWLVDARAAYEAMLAHPLVEAKHVAAYLDLLGVVHGRIRQARVLRRALAKWPMSGKLHGYLRTTALRDGGAAGLEAAYEALEVPQGYAATVDWFAGLATLVAAERNVQNRAVKAARAAYDRSTALFERSIAAQASFADTANHYICLAQAGTARLAAAAGDLALAAEALERGLRARPASAGAKDGLGHTPSDNAKLVLRALERGGQGDRASALRARLAELGIEL